MIKRRSNKKIDDCTDSVQVFVDQSSDQIGACADCPAYRADRAFMAVVDEHKMLRVVTLHCKEAEGAYAQVAPMLDVTDWKDCPRQQKL